MEQLNTFLSLLSDGKTSYHTVDFLTSYFMERGFEKVTLEQLQNMELTQDKCFFYSPYPSALFAFRIGEHPKKFHIAAAHTDFPMLKVKTNPEINKKGYLQINVEPYGGIIKESWFDRPLGLAGRIFIKGENAFSPKQILFDSEQALFIIPNLAPHLKRSDKSDSIDVQKEMLPLFSMDTSKEVSKTFFMDYIAEKANINKADILDFDLYLYIYDSPVFVGMNNNFLTAARIDNLSSCSAIVEALCSETPKDCIAVGAFFDNEEIGSRSKQGADSLLLRDILTSFSFGKEFLYNSFSFSVDVAHATHPNYQEKNDITNDIILGKGVVLKSSASQRYVTDSEASAICLALCKENNILIQRQVNRSGMPGGQTLGPLMSSYLPIKSCDLGVPMLAMHSARETICGADYIELRKLIQAFYRA